jgi:Tol biopolymer transport system component
MKDQSDLVDVIRAIASGSSVDWDSVAGASSDASITSVLNELKVISRIAEVHGNTRADAVALDAETDEQLHSWGPLTILERVGRGSYGDVYRAWDSRLDRDVALKLLRRDMTRATEQSPVIEEGSLLARVRHPNVLVVHGAECITGRVGIWTEFIEGHTLQQLVAEGGPMMPNDVISIGVDVCRALHAVHNAGLLHRDVKAQNVMRENGGRIVLMDFGTTWLAENSATGLAGTPLYLAPELLTGGRPTVTSDIYSVGVLLYYLLTGRHPVEGATLDDVRSAHQHGWPSRIAQLPAEVPSALATVIKRALAAEPSHRFESADAMADALAKRSFSPALPLAKWLAVAVVIAAIVLLATSAGRRTLSLAGAPPPNGAMPHGSELAAMPTARRLPFPAGIYAGSGFSFDGRYFSMADVQGNLAVLETSTNVTTTIVRADSDHYVELSIMSPDGETIAYEWSGPHGTELRRVERSGDHARVLIPDEGLNEPVPLQWSQDGSKILVMLIGRDATRRIALVEPSTGQLRIVRGFSDGAPISVSLSADGAYVAYDLRSRGLSRRRIYVINADGSDDHPVFDEAHGDDRYAFWTPDGHSLFFISNRSGTPDGWVVPMQNGMAIAEAKLAVRNLGRVRSLGFTQAGGFYYYLRTGSPDVYEIDLDPATGASRSKARVVPSAFNGSNIGPSYSPDGERLAYISMREGLTQRSPDRVLVIQDRRTGAEHEVATPLDLGVMPAQWAPDGRRLLVHGTNRKNQWGVFVIDADSGIVQHQLVWPTQDMTDYGWVCWAPDGRAILFEHSARGIVRHDIAGGQEAVVFPRATDVSLQRLRRFGFTRDGRQLALTEIKRDGSTVIAVVDDGNVRELARHERPQGAVFQSWSADGQDVYYTTFLSNNMKQPHELWRVAARGGLPERVKFAVPGNTQQNPMAFDPNGSAAAYTAGVPTEELWMMEHFLTGASR